MIEEQGHGVMGKVYKLFDTKIKEKVALELIKPEVASDKETIERFSNELRLARQISHRNVCRMYDLGESEGAHYITMEYVPGENLKRMIRMSRTIDSRHGGRMASRNGQSSPIGPRLPEKTGKAPARTRKF